MKSAVEIKDVINKLIQTGAKNLLFDLRSNNGGYLEKVLELLACSSKKMICSFILKQETITIQ
jgi:C-terminal processing protease CtpA/Prc